MTRFLAIMGELKDQKGRQFKAVKASDEPKLLLLTVLIPPNRATLVKSGEKWLTGLIAFNSPLNQVANPARAWPVTPNAPRFDNWRLDKTTKGWILSFFVDPELAQHIQHVCNGEVGTPGGTLEVRLGGQPLVPDLDLTPYLTPAADVEMEEGEIQDQDEAPPAGAAAAPAHPPIHQQNNQ